MRPEQDGAGAAGAPEPPGGPAREYDPLTDPLPDPAPGPAPSGRHGSPWFRAERPASPAQPVQDPPQDWYGREAVYEPIAPPAGPVTPPEQAMRPEPFPQQGHPAADPEGSTAVFPAVRDDGVRSDGVRSDGVRGDAVRDTAVRDSLGGDAGRGEAAAAEDAAVRDSPVWDDPVRDDLVRDDETVGLRVSAADRPAVPTGGRAERRKAAKGRGRRGAAPAAPAEPVIPAIPRTRMEARLAARALKDSPAVIASRAIGEIFISLGVLMLLFVTYQLWWTNVRAHQEANGTAHSLQDNWAKGGDNKPGAFEPGQGFAIIHIPKLDVVVPIAEGVSKTKVLDRGMVGHYSEGKLKTAMPSAKTGNFALAGHRNTHGEPFRYINKLKDGDKVVVETQDDYYTYEVTSRLAQTSPSNVSVIQPVPVGSGFTRPGRYITLTTCTPEFTSTYRMVVWGKMVDERPRSKGMPEALTGG
ncbi:class E sortase [Streptomyces sp. NBC_01089]|uniref:class E sortase n=1 Tax=Streptomyces sp. NBC_01089 TaxID=2903747 RepID=UPI0038631CCA